MKAYRHKKICLKSIHWKLNLQIDRRVKLKFQSYQFITFQIKQLLTNLLNYISRLSKTLFRVVLSTIELILSPNRRDHNCRDLRTLQSITPCNIHLTIRDFNTNIALSHPWWCKIFTNFPLLIYNNTSILCINYIKDLYSRRVSIRDRYLREATIKCRDLSLRDNYHWNMDQLTM